MSVDDACMTVLKENTGPDAHDAIFKLNIILVTNIYKHLGVYK